MTTDYEQTSSSGSPMGTALKYGAIGGLILIIFSLIMYLLDLEENQALGWIQWIIAIVIIVLAIRAHKNDNLDGSMTYGQGMGVGVLTALFIGIIVAVYMIIFMTVIDPNAAERQLEIVRNQMLEQNPDMTDDQMEMGMKFARMFANPWISAIGAIFLYTLIGTIASLIASAFIKNR